MSMSVVTSAGAVTAAGAVTSAQPQLPNVNPALEPEAVRNGSPAVQSAYREGLGFEQMLTEELSKTLVESGGLGGEGGSEAEAQAEGGLGGESSGLGAGGSQLVGALLPHALAEGVVRGGGLGLAAQLAGEIAPGRGA